MTCPESHSLDLNQSPLLPVAEGAFTGSLSRILAFSLCSGEVKPLPGREAADRALSLPCPGHFQTRGAGTALPSGAVLPSLGALLTLLKTHRRVVWTCCPALCQLPFGLTTPGHTPSPERTCTHPAHLDNPRLPGLTSQCPFQTVAARAILLNVFFSIWGQLLAFQGHFESCKFVQKISHAFLSFHTQNACLCLNIHLPWARCQWRQWTQQSEERTCGTRTKTLPPPQPFPPLLAHSHSHIFTPLVALSPHSLPLLDTPAPQPSRPPLLCLPFQILFQLHSDLS